MSATGHVLLAPDKFKGSLSAGQVAAHLRNGLLRTCATLDVATVPVADGGDGTLEAAEFAGFTRRTVEVAGPTGDPVQAAFVVRADTAVVELSEASGLRRLPGGRHDPMHASSRGTGELVRAALDAGATRVVIGLGGSACTDGGAGLVQALGARLLDRSGAELAPGGAALIRLHRLDVSDLDPRLAHTQVVIASDVDNPLLGPRGAAAVYGPQKGATPDDVARLESALAHWAATVTATLGRSVVAHPGAGAAGGVGFAALALLDATLVPGIDMLLELVGFERARAGARLVITGEGRLDEQTLSGKAPAGVAAAATRAGVPVVAVAGASMLDRAQTSAAGISAVYTLAALEPDPARCLAEAGDLLERLGAQIAKDLLAARPVTREREVEV